MTVETAREVSTNPEVLKRLAKNTQQCFRHTMLEDLHAGLLRTRRPATTQTWLSACLTESSLDKTFATERRGKTLTGRIPAVGDVILKFSRSRGQQVPRQRLQEFEGLAATEGGGPGFTLLGSARRRGLNPQAYLSDVLTPRQEFLGSLLEGFCVLTCNGEKRSSSMGTVVEPACHARNLPFWGSRRSKAACVPSGERAGMEIPASIFASLSRWQ
jgi:hypothetical protein